MTTEVVAFKPDERVRDVAQKLKEKGISGAPVVDDEGRVIGVISELDIIKLTATIPFPNVDPMNPFAFLSIHSYMKKVEKMPDEIEELFEGRVKDIMSRKPTTISPDALLSDAARIMHKNDFNRIPIVDKEEKLIGIIAREDLIRVFTLSQG